MIRLHFPTIPFPVGILQHFQREDEKASLLLQPSGNTSGCLTGDTQSQVEVVAADFFSCASFAGEVFNKADCNTENILRAEAWHEEQLTLEITDKH